MVSALSSHPQATNDRVSLANLLSPMQFKTVLLFAYGLKNSEIAQILGTTERVIQNALRDAYNRTGCWNSRELLCRYLSEVASGLLELARLRRELAELEALAAQSHYARPQDLLRRMN